LVANDSVTVGAAGCLMSNTDLLVLVGIIVGAILTFLAGYLVGRWIRHRRSHAA
jgi:H+/gluconate symporter-like permease